MSLTPEAIEQIKFLLKEGVIVPLTRYELGFAPGRGMDRYPILPAA